MQVAFADSFHRNELSERRAELLLAKCADTGSILNQESIESE